MVGERADMRVQTVLTGSGFAWLEGAKSLPHLAVLDVPLHGEQRLQRMLAQRGGKRDLFCSANTCRLQIRCAELLQQHAREALDHCLPVRLRRLGDNSKCGPAEAVDTQKAGTQRNALLLSKRFRSLVPEY